MCLYFSLNTWPADTSTQYRPVKKWKTRYRAQWLDEVVRTDGRGDHVVHPKCVCGHPWCRSGKAEVRCKDCHGCELLAKECMVREHERNPLHRTEIWNEDEGCFDSVTLKTLGLRFYLGRELHHDRICPRPKRAPGKKFIVIDDYGLHDVELHYCGCGKGGSFSVQLLRIKWLPSTGKRPRTAATFNVLRRYHLLSLESKCSMSEFYNSLARHTNNTGEPPASRYQEFINMTRQWRNIQILKRAGRAHETDGIAKTKEGACALECPACPHPGKNLPPEWKDVPQEQRFLYALFLAIDANFRMQRKDVSSEAADADLGNGLAFFGEITAYMDHLEKNWDKYPQPKSTCVAHDAVNTPDKEVRGTASSGIGTVDCARHNMKRPRGVGDLQRGERYVNMDYMFFMSLADSELQEFYVSYDIACQWHKNVWDRMQIYPSKIQLVNKHRYFVWLVPKFHLPAHIESCGVEFSFLLTRYVGQTDGEAPERGWSNINPLALSTREMGPHLRREVLDDHFNDWNWKKILNMGKYFLEKITHYVPEMVKTRKETLEQQRTLPLAAVVQWTGDCVAWEENPKNTNPFQRKTEEITIASIRYQLAAEGGGMVRGETPSAEMLANGISLETEQRRLKFDQAAAGLHPTLNQKREMLERCGKVRRKLLSWMETQVQFMPEVTVVRAAAAAERAATSGTKPVDGELVQDMELLLPSALEPDASLQELQEYELRLREGQAHEALYELRHQLLLRTHEYKYKDQNARGIRDISRSLTKLEGIENNIKHAAATYRVTYKAMSILGERLGKWEWAKMLRVLKEDDVRQMPEAVFRKPGTKRQKETHNMRKKRKLANKGLSWIWLADGSAADADRNPAMNEALRMEWARTRALGLRNTEEVDLLEEEMRRTPEFLRWRADWWESRKIHQRKEERPDLVNNARQREGHDAYATRQARILRSIASRFEKKWAGVASMVAGGRAQVVVAEAEAAEAAEAFAAVEAARAAHEEPLANENESDEGDDEGDESEGESEGEESE
ncbi:hypothetical protein C8R47DRAFT_996066 [Mycena vitilis]|nr:hypothetical protein C8R47DRAFT_996066 [Mycena vitilis]